MIARSGKWFFLFIVVFCIFTVDCHGRGLFGGLGRSLRQVGRDVTNTVKETTQGIKSDVQTETGIPIAQMEMRDRMARIRKKIKQIRMAVVKPGVADGAIVFFWNSISNMDMEDGESLRKVVEYTEGTITDIRKEGISVKKLGRVVEKLERYLMVLSEKREDLSENFDFVATFKLAPVEGNEPDVDDDGGDDGGDDGDSGDEYGESEDDEDSADDGADPVTKRYQELLAKHGDGFQGSGYLKVGAGKEASEAVFAIMDPASGTILTQDAAVNRNHKIAAGIYHLVVDVADVRLYKLNVLILAGNLVKFDYVDFGQIQIGQDVSGTVEIYDNASGRLACEGVSAGEKITLPVGEYVVVNVDSGDERTVTVKRKKRKRVTF